MMIMMIMMIMMKKMIMMMIMMITCTGNTSLQLSLDCLLHHGEAGIVLLSVVLGILSQGVHVPGVVTYGPT